VFVALCAAVSSEQALKDNITTLGPHVLPMSEMLVFGANLIATLLCAAVTCKQGAEGKHHNAGPTGTTKHNLP
jgi:hypothetical protein